jgi:hypothetical protein
MHFPDRHRFREIVKLIAVGTRQVSAPHRNDVRQQWMVGRSEGARNHRRTPQIAMQSEGLAAESVQQRPHIPRD